MRLSYGDLLSPAPLYLEFWCVSKPTLRQIAEISFGVYDMFLTFANISPDFYFKALCPPQIRELWDQMDDAEKADVTMFSLAIETEQIAQVYQQMLNFFSPFNVVFEEQKFLALNDKEEVVGAIITQDQFDQVMSFIRQVCNITDDEQEEEKNPQFEEKSKNTAKKIFDKLMKAKRETQKQKKNDINMSMPNLISAVSNRSHSINPINVWDLTVYQLYDSFMRLCMSEQYNISARNVSVWGDEKKRFDSTTWYENSYDKSAKDVDLFKIGG